jgi:hypothetical protein
VLILNGRKTVFAVVASAVAASVAALLPEGKGNKKARMKRGITRLRGKRDICMASLYNRVGNKRRNYLHQDIEKLPHRQPFSRSCSFASLKV